MSSECPSVSAVGIAVQCTNKVGELSGDAGREKKEMACASTLTDRKLGSAVPRREGPWRGRGKWPPSKEGPHRHGRSPSFATRLAVGAHPASGQSKGDVHGSSAAHGSGTRAPKAGHGTRLLVARAQCPPELARQC